MRRIDITENAELLEQLETLECLFDYMVKGGIKHTLSFRTPTKEYCIINDGTTVRLMEFVSDEIETLKKLLKLEE